MKILVIAPTPFFADRGTHIRILEESLALEKLGHEITIVTYHIGKDIQSEVETNIDIRRIRRWLFWYTKLEAGPDWQKILLDLLLIRKALYLAYVQRPDIIHAHIHEGVALGWIVQKCLFWRKIKLVADFHGSLTKEMVSHSYLNGGFLKGLFSWAEKWINNMGDAALTSSAENTQEIEHIRKDHKVQTVLDGANLFYFEKLPSKSALKIEFELPADKVIVTYTGALVPNKGVQYLKEAILAVLQKNPNIFFVIAGFPAEDMSEFVAQNKLETSVRVISPLSYFKLPAILAASDIGVDPKDSSVRQASGKILQYMAASLPVVCFDRQNNRTYLDQGGQFAHEISAQGLAGEILALADNSEQMRKKGEFNRIRVKNFSWEISAKKIEQIYNSII